MALIHFCNSQNKNNITVRILAYFTLAKSMGNVILGGQWTKTIIQSSKDDWIVGVLGCQPKAVGETDARCELYF